MTRERPQTRIVEICSLAPVISVVSIRDVGCAARVARALVSGGLPTIEVVFADATAPAVIQAMRDEAPEAVVGAGRLQHADDVDRALHAGAQFATSVGSNNALTEAALGSDLPFMPGCASPSEAMHLADQGFEILRLSPADALGGVSMLDPLARALPNLHFCAAGGFGAETAQTYLRRANVCCIAGSWLAPEALIAAGDWPGISTLASEAAAFAA